MAHAKFFFYTKLNAVVLWQFVGIAVSGQNRLEYGSNKYTRYTVENSQPNIYDGFLSIPLPPQPGIDFWMAFTYTIYPKSTLELKKAECFNPDISILGKVKETLGLTVKSELATKAAAEIYLKTTMGE